MYDYDGDIGIFLEGGNLRLDAESLPPLSPDAGEERKSEWVQG
jgi:hypothetical protein